MSVLGVIPARFGSTRFPGKPLALIAGKSLVQRVWERARAAVRLDGLVVATEDGRIVEHVASFGGQAVLTSAAHQSGTDRLGEVAQAQVYDYYVNIQGDEPLVSPGAIDALIGATLPRGAAMSTLVTPLPEGSPDVGNPNAVKVVRDKDGYALYFSRSPVPYARNAPQAPYLKHIGIYMYSRQTLGALCALPPAQIELTESLEQLRALHNGIRILTVDTDYDPVAVDVPEDIARAEARLRELGIS